MRKFSILILFAGMALALGGNPALADEQAVTPNDSTAANPIDSAAANFFTGWSTEGLFHTGVKPGATMAFNPATPQGWAVLLGPKTHELGHMAFTNPANYVQFMTPQFYMQFMNPSNWMAWINPASYATFMDPNTYTYWMTPQAYTHFMSPTSYMQMMNPAAYTAFFNPATYMAWVDPAQYTLAAAPTGTAQDTTDFFTNFFGSFTNSAPVQ
ncbi:MAG: hypothetical protein OEQ18_07225 [Gammaproteobacteria bacterium]|nr:hypothetical protein [Gammaproteobacteria bacterium]